MRWLFKKNDVITVQIEGVEKQTDKATLIKYCGYTIWLPNKEISIEKQGDKTFVNLTERLHKEKFFFIGRKLINLKRSWECPNCKHINPYHQSVCYHCMT